MECGREKRKKAPLQCLLHRNSFHGAHFLTAKAGDAALFLKFRFFIFDIDDMGGTAFGTFAAAHAQIFV